MKLSELLRSKNTVFSLKDLAILWSETNYDNLKSQANYYVKTGQLKKLRAGFYAKDSKYQHFELACKIYTPAYISLNTVLGIEGVNFQYQSSIFVLSYLNRELLVDGQSYQFRKIKSSVLSNPEAIINREGYSIASCERAVLDTLYLMPNFYFDNLDPINWDKCFDLLPIYQNNSLTRRLEKLYKRAKDEGYAK